MNNNDTDIEVTSYVEPQAPDPFLHMQWSPLQLQLLESATEMGLDLDHFKKEILTDEDCLRGLTLVET